MKEITKGNIEYASQTKEGVVKFATDEEFAEGTSTDKVASVKQIKDDSIEITYWE